MRSSHLVCSFIGIVIHLWNTPGLSAASRVNVAMNGKATQSSTYQVDSAGPASKAIDGNSNSDLRSHSFSHTNKQVKPWWRVQLLSVYKVAEIEVTKMSEGPERVAGVEILIGNSPENFGNDNPRCGTITNINNLTQTFQCRGMEGQFINLYKPCGEGALMFTEVKVYGELVLAPSSTSTLVMGRNVTLVGKRLCWSDALFYCRDFHSDLLSIRGPEEQQIIQQLVASASFPLTSHLWVGLRRAISGTSWFWMTGDSMSFTQWEQGPVASNYPSHWGGVASMEPSTWTPLYCDEHLNFICFTGPAEGVNKVRFYSSRREPNICDE